MNEPKDGRSKIRSRKSKLCYNCIMLEKLSKNIIKESDGVTHVSAKEIEDQDFAIKDILNSAENGLYDLEKYDAEFPDEEGNRVRVRVKNKGGKILYDFPESVFYQHAGELYARVEKAFRSQKEGHA